MPGPTERPRLGDFSPDDIPNLNASKITAGTFDPARLPSPQISGELTGTGSPQTWAHNLGTTPRAFVVIPQAGHNGSGAAGTQAVTVSGVTADATEVTFTASAGAKVRVLALA